MFAGPGFPDIFFRCLDVKKVFTSGLCWLNVYDFDFRPNSNIDIDKMQKGRKKTLNIKKLKGKKKYSDNVTFHRLTQLLWQLWPISL